MTKNRKKKQEEGKRKEYEMGTIEKENEVEEARIMSRRDEKHEEESKKLETKSNEEEKKEMNERTCKGGP
jgi:hypothetical protein